MLESLREYGLERLHERGEYAEMRDRHRSWYVDLVEGSRERWISPEQIELAVRLDRELPNVRAAFDSSVMAPGERSASLRLTECLHLYWVSRGLLTEGRRWLARALASDPEGAVLERICALYSAVALAGMQADHVTASYLLAETSALNDTLDDPLSRSVTAHAAGVTGLFTGDLPLALEKLAAAVDGFRQLGDLNRLVEALIGLALGQGFSGDDAAAMVSHEEVLSITEPRGEVWSRAYSLWAYGLAVWRMGDLDRATRLLEDSLRLKVQLDDLLGAVWCLEALAFIAADREDHQRSATLLGASATLSSDFGTQSGTFPALIGAYEATTSRARAALGERGFELAHAEGAGLSYADATAYALRETHQAGATRTSSVLTPRELDVAALIAEGLTNKAIANRLVISQRTVQGHVENILAKLGFSSRTQVAAWMAENGS